jgi:aryl-alcohol dehydrogenase-like predicted oxidoreductase
MVDAGSPQSHTRPNRPEREQAGLRDVGLRGLPGGRAVRDIDAAAASALLNQVLDSGINFIDTSPDYGRSEERIGQHLSGRRGDFILASKCGCLVSSDGSPVGSSHHDFSRRNIRAGAEQSLRRMKTDHLDLVQFHAARPE